MQSSAVPSKIQLPFANAGAKNTIPVASQIATNPGQASFTDGFPPATRTPLAAGGVPPSGQDMNGILNQITSILQWQSAGGEFPYDATFAAAIGGYPAGAIVMSNDNTQSFLCTQDNNTNDPNAATPVGWRTFSAGRLVGVKAFVASGTYTPTIGTKAIIVEAVGAGGGSGGVPATSTNSTGLSSAGAGGAYAKSYLTTGFSSGVAVTIGAGGIAGTSAGASGGTGGTTSFGALLSCPGGTGSTFGTQSTGVTNTPPPGPTTNASGTGIIQFSNGAPVLNAIQAAPGFATGFGAVPSPMPGTLKGQGANGVYSTFSQPAATGLVGNPGFIIVYEFA